MNKNETNHYLYHYFENQNGPFRNLSDLELDEAEMIQDNLRKDDVLFSSKRSKDYIRVRRELEEQVREIFISIGGKPNRKVPHYMTLGECAWFQQWYRETNSIRVPIEEFDLDTVSFTYGDMFPTMRFDDGKAYRKRVYTYKDILKIIDKFGWPQEWNINGKLGPERYIEAQVWSDDILAAYGYI